MPYQYNPTTRRYEQVGEPTGGRQGGSLRSILGLPEEEAPVTPEPTEDEGWGEWAAMGLRGAAGFVPGGPWGAAAGAGSELVAQLLEGRDDLNWGQVAAQGGLGFIPFGKKLGSVGQAALRGSAHGALGGGVTQFAETGFEDPEALVKSTVLGGTIGGAAGGTLRKLSDVLKAPRTSGSDRYSPNVRRVPDTHRGTFEERPGGGGGTPIGVRPNDRPARGSTPYRSNTTDIPDPAGAPSSTYTTDNFRPTRVRERGPDTFTPSHPEYRSTIPEDGPIGVRERGPDAFTPSEPEYRSALPEDGPIATRPYEPSDYELRQPNTLAPEAPQGLADLLGARTRPRLTAQETAGVLKGREKFSDAVGLDYGQGGVAPGFYDELDRMGVEYGRTQRELKRLLGLPDADPQEVARLQQGARELGSRLRKGAKLPPISGGEPSASAARVPDEILPPESQSLARPTDPLNAIEVVDELPHAQVRPQASEVGELAAMLRASLENVPQSRRTASMPTEVPAPVAPAAPKYASKIANDTLGGGPKVPKGPNVTDDQASALRRLFSERGARGVGGGTARPETSDDLMRRGLPPEFSGMLGDESGFTTLENLHAMSSGAIGAGAGYLFSPDDHKRLGTAAGFAAGIGGYGAFKRPDLWEQYTTAAMLSSPKTFAKIIGGNVGGPLIKAGQKAFVDQDPGVVGRTAKEIFSGDTVDAFTNKFRESAGAVDAERLGPGYATSGPASWPGRVIGSLDYASKDAMSRAGFSPEDAARITMTSEPQNPLLAKMLNAQREHRAARIPFPFFKTAANSFEQGLLEPVQSAQRVLGGEGSRQDLATLATVLGVGGAGYLAGDQLPYWAEPFAVAAAGPWMAPAAIGAAMTHTTKNASPVDKLIQMSRSAAQQLPLAEAADYDPRQLIARTVPNISRDAATLLDDKERTTDEGLLDSAIAKIPFLREYLKPKKRKKRD